MICFNKSEAFRCDKQTPCHNARKNVIGNITTHRDLILRITSTAVFPTLAFSIFTLFFLYLLKI